MKKQSLKGLAFIAVASSMLASCDQLKDLDYKVTPCPLEMHNDSIRIKVDVTLPEKGIKKKARAEITPMLGSTPLKTVTIQGEKATGNGTVIQYKPGGKFTYTDVVAYKPEYEETELAITGKVYKGSKEKDEIERTVICTGTILTPNLANRNFKVIMAKDEFKRVNEMGYMATINYLKGKSEVRSTELNDKDIKDLEKWMMMAQTNPKIAVKSINITGYASPEGEEDKNNTLSTDRAGSAKTASMNLAKKAKNEKGQTEIYNLNGKGEDYEGFKVELAKSKMNEDDKQLVMRVLEMYKDPAQREVEMRNMGKTFTYLDNNVFPQLRRSEIKVVYDQTGYSDEELKAVSQSKIDTLNLEELLFTATLTDDLNEKLRLYKQAQKKYPNDYRAYNNAGGVYYMQNKMTEAKSEFEMANSKQDNPISKNNLAAISGTQGDFTKSKMLLDQAKGAGPEVNYNMGIINIKRGEYAAAVSNFGSEPSYNKALAQMLNGDANAALATIDASPDKETAQGYYLKAIIAARQDKVDLAASNLKSSIAKDPSMKAKAKKDKEFYKYADNSSFTSVIN